MSDGVLKLKIFGHRDGRVVLRPSGASAERWASLNRRRLAAILLEIGRAPRKARKASPEHLAAVKAAVVRALRAEWPEHDYRVRVLSEREPKGMCPGCVRFAEGKARTISEAHAARPCGPPEIAGDKFVELPM
jgi:hypothetical protein